MSCGWHSLEMRRDPPGVHMKRMKLFVAVLLGVLAAKAPAQMGDHKDPYTDDQNGKQMAPAAALDAMLSTLEFQAVKAAEAMPADKYSFAPSADTFAANSAEKFSGVRTFAQQVAHVAQANYFFYASLNGAKPPVDVKAIGSMSSKEDLVAALKQSFVFAHTQIGTVTPANAFTGIKGADGMHTPATLAAFGVAHGYDHYGQMVEYMRMNGVLPFGSK